KPRGRGAMLDEARAAGDGAKRWRQPLSEFERDPQQSEGGATKATARLPGLDIEVIHRQSTGGDAEQISIHLQAVPSFEAFGRFLEQANPFAFWVLASRLAWLSWLEAARVAMLPFSGTPALLKADSDARPPQSHAERQWTSEVVHRRPQGDAWLRLGQGLARASGETVWRVRSPEAAS